MVKNLVWRLARRFLREPLERLTQAARAVGAGDFSVRVGLSGDPAEVQRAGDAFDEMTRQLEENKRILDESNHELLEISARLSEAQKLEAIGMLAGGVAHDFNNLLTVVRGSLELLEEEGPLAEGQEELIQDAMSAVVRAEVLTSRLLSFSRKQRLAPETVNLNKLVTGLRPVLEQTLGPEIRLWFQLSAAAPSCTADPTQLENAILNLALNAREAMENGGRLTIATGYAVGSEAGLEGRRYAYLTVADQGVGMSSEVATRAPEPFFTTKDRGRGTGLGLSGAFGFAKQSGGELQLDTAPGIGTTVLMYLPAASGVGRRATGTRTRRDDSAVA